MAQPVRLRAFAVLFLLIAIFFIMAVATEVYVDEYVKPHTLFMSLLVSTIISGVASLGVNLPVPD